MSAGRYCTFSQTIFQRAMDGSEAAVMRTMGHRDVKIAMHYQHPELEIVRAALDYRPPSAESAA